MEDCNCSSALRKHLRCLAMLHSEYVGTILCDDVGGP